MNYKDLLDEKIFYWFSEISKIPRESGNEKEISDFLVKFANDRNLEVIQDDALNVLIKKDATSGYEDRPVVAIQGHMDMVCVKNEDSDHDFENDPIKLLVEDGWITADGTTLGADNGLAVAYILAVLDSDNIEHGPLEALITTAEETSMGGAMALDSSILKADYLLNIDSEEEGIFTLGCAGGVEIDFEIKRENEKPSDDDRFIEISAKNFYGGHSGMEVANYRGNAILKLGRLLNKLEDFKIGTIEGGVKKNAIPTSAKAVVAIKDMEKAKSILEEESNNIIDENKSTDPDAEITFGEVEFDKEVVSVSQSRDIVDFLYVIPDGVYEKDLELGYIVSSSNLGVLKDEDGYIKGTDFVRSENTSKKLNKRDIIITLARNYGFSVDENNGYPGWQREDSPINDLFLKLWKEETGEDAELNVTHGGLECGVLKDKMNDTQFISFGPDIENAHSPRERLNIESARRVYEFLVSALKEIR